MSTSIAISSVALAQSAAANSAAQEARRIACTQFVQTFDAKAATVQAAQEYSGCIALLYPSGGTDLSVKILIGMVLFGLFAGAVAGAISDGHIEGGFMGALFGMMAGFFLFMVGMGFWLLFH